MMCAALMGCWIPEAEAHHILGIPHYAYDEQYPQTPVLTYRVDAGANEVKMTGYPGVPEPGEQGSLHVYIRRRETGKLFDGPVTLTVMEDRLIQSDPVVYGPITARLEDSLYKFYPQYAAEANYVVRIEFEADGAPWTIDLPIVVGEPGSPWLVLGGVGGATLIFLIVVRAVRIKMRRGDYVVGKAKVAVAVRGTAEPMPTPVGVAGPLPGRSHSRVPR